MGKKEKEGMECGLRPCPPAGTRKGKIGKILVSAFPENRKKLAEKQDKLPKNRVLGPFFLFPAIFPILRRGRPQPVFFLFFPISGLSPENPILAGGQGRKGWAGGRERRGRGRGTGRERERERDKDREKERERERERDKDREKERERERDTKTERKRERERESE